MIAREDIMNLSDAKARLRYIAAFNKEMTKVTNDLLRKGATEIVLVRSIREHRDGLIALIQLNSELTSGVKRPVPVRCKIWDDPDLNLWANLIHIHPHYRGEP